MAKFVFKLQPVLNLKQQKEESKKNELGKAIQRLEAEKRTLAGLENSLTAAVNEFNEKTKKTTVHELIEYNEYISLLNSKIRTQKENVNNAASYVDKVREELLSAVKERKILEKLKEKKHEEYMTEQKKLEQKTNDEIVSYKHNESSSGD
jgi:flagellar FliJ protein